MTTDFSRIVWHYYEHNKRTLPWRDIAEISLRERGYKVLVSEVMLQQTQVARVTEKYTEWMTRWPTIDAFSSATLADVLVMWNGLGYNRRAKFLYETLNIVFTEYAGVLPKDATLLQKLPGIGPNTAAALIVYTYNLPVAFVETNIRTVYLYSFFADKKEQITDIQILHLVKDTIDAKNPREWFYALMDYGTYLKKNYGNQLHKAKAHKKQSTFKGSKRQVRGAVLKLLANVQYMTDDEIAGDIKDSRLKLVLQELATEGMLEQKDGRYTLPNR